MASLLSLDRVSKEYASLDGREAPIKLVWNLLRRRQSARSFRALDNISFVLEQGASLGIIGENGAGKSTLLKVVAGVIAPTRGAVKVNGRVGALLELGSGFHPEYTGLANIDLAAALLGLSSTEIEAKREHIIEFADLGEHINEPIKHYSSGMVVRLGFAVATTLRPDLLITDEVLAVGDESFQKKCVAWMEDYLANGGTLLLCAHSMFHIQKLCRDALWLHNGSIAEYGPAASVTQAYLAYHERKTATHKQPIEATVAATAGVYAIQSLTILPGDHVAQFEPLTIDGEVYSPDDRIPVVLVGIIRSDGTPIYGVSTDMEGVKPIRVATNRFVFRLTFESLPLLPGQYIVRGHALDPEGVRLFDHVERPFTVGGKTRELGLLRLPHEWSA